MRNQWIYRSPAAFPFSGLAAVDGSATDPVRRLVSRGGAAVAVPTLASANSNYAVHLEGMLYGTFPYDNPDSEACEIFGIFLALANCLPPVHIVCDCLNVVTDINEGRHTCCSYDHPLPIWREVWRRLADHGATCGSRHDPAMFQVIKTPAHDTWEAASSKGAIWRELQRN